MIRFILLTFGFLGWAFYEMSGGADFEPLQARLDAERPAQDVKDITVADARDNVDAIVDTSPPANDDVVTRVALNLTTLGDVTKETEPQQDQNVPQAEPENGVPENVGVLLSNADTPAIIPSLIVPNDTGIRGQTLEASSDAVGDLRSVSGNRVNVRGGPGTDFGVVSRLVRGDMVEVLDDDGNGWVRMRPLDGGPEGWMADFLLDAG